MHSFSHPEAAAGRLFFNGRIHTADSAFSRASVLAVRNGVILYAGHSQDEAASLLSPDAERVDLLGHTVIPGLIDSHLHFLTQGRRLSEIDIFHKSKNDILRLVAQEAQRLKPGEWILGRGWNHETWPENVWPCKEDLDAVAPANPVALTRSDAHSMWLNSPALLASGFERDSETPQGGEILRTPGGDLQGILIDTPIFKVWAAIPPLNDEQTLNAYQKAQAELFGLGITSVGDAWQTRKDFESLSKAYAGGTLKIRMYGMLGSVDFDDRPCLRADDRPVHGLFGERLSLRAFKVVLDGSLGSRSAWLTGDYADRPGHKGNGRYTDEELFELAAPAAKKGFQICAHAIGDAAVLQALRVLEKIRAEEAGTDRRHRIEHFQIVAPQDVQRAVSLGIIPAMQTIHALADKKMAAIRLGPEALRHSYPWREVLDRGGVFANGSDSPMEVVNPFYGMHAAVTRTDFQSLEGTPRPPVRLTREEALRSYTTWAAYAEFTESRKGSLEPGKLADFAVLDRDIMTCPENGIRDTQVLMTVLGGETVHHGTKL